MIDISKLTVGKRYKCVLAHWHELVTTKHEVVLVKVDESDTDFRFEDGSELSHDWHVESAEVIE